MPDPADLRLLPTSLYRLKAAAVRARSWAWLARSGHRAGGATGGVRILFYHRVADDPDPLAVAPWRFRAHMDVLHERGYRVVDVVEAARLLAAGAGERVVGLTFDDGYHDIADHALPVLVERGFRASVFVVTGALDGRPTFNWYATVPPLLSWDEVVDLDRDAGSPFRFEAHSLSHPNLLTLDDAAARREVTECKAILEARLGRPVEAFCYPAGFFGPRERALVAEAGYRAAVSCEPGLNRAGTDPLALHRTQVEAWDSVADFKARVGGGHDSPLPLRAAFRRLRYGAGG
jgi:peptidoglycan/xylan/chitin deacetylase (PgdA/CDA1 family)